MFSIFSVQLLWGFPSQVAAFHETVTVRNGTEVERCGFIYLFDQIKLFNILVHYSKCAVVLEEKCIQSCSKMRSTAHASCPIKSDGEEAFFPCNGPPLHLRPTESVFVPRIEQPECSHSCIVGLRGQLRQCRVQVSSNKQLFTELCNSSVHCIW